MAYPTPPPTISPGNGISGHKLPAHDSYFYSSPSSSTQPYAPSWGPSKPTTFAPFPQQTQQQIITQPRISSPLIPSSSPYQPPQNQQYNPSIASTYTRPYTPLQKPTPTGSTTPPKPFYYSPTNPIPSPYSSSRPKPRPGFRKRTLAKISSWIRSLALWAKKNPIKAGLMTFVPVLAVAGVTRMFGGFGKIWGKGKEGFDKVVGESRKSVKIGEKAKKEGKRGWDWGLDEFVGFNGSKGGPLDGMLKMLHMWVTHICRVTPSMVPRTMAVILELYFLELEK